MKFFNCIEREGDSWWRNVGVHFSSIKRNIEFGFENEASRYFISISSSRRTWFCICVELFGYGFNFDFMYRPLDCECPRCNGAASK